MELLRSAPPHPVIPAALDGAIDYSDVGIDPNATVVVCLGPWADFESGDRLQVLWGESQTVVGTGVYTVADGAVAQVAVPSSRIVLAGEGQQRVIVRVIAGPGVYVDSPPVSVDVKFNVPGGIHPNPDNRYENLSLALPVVEPDPLVDDFSGTTVRVAPYENMLEGDRITVTWNAQAIPSTPVEASQVGTAISVAVPQGVVEASRGTNARVTYHVHDRAGNWSCWARPTYIDVPGDLPGAQPAPWVEDTVDDGGTALDLKALASRDVIVRVEGHHAGGGDSITVHWEGVTCAGKSVAFVSDPQPVRRPGQTIDATVPNRYALALAASSVEVWYQVATASGETLTSAHRRLAVPGEPQVLEAPYVAESDGVTLDPAAAKDGVHVLVLPWPGVSEDDRCYMEWIGTRENGQQTFFYAGMTGADVSADGTFAFEIPSDEVTRISGGSVRVRYKVVVHANGTEDSDIGLIPLVHLVSPWLNLKVTESREKLSIDSTPVDLSGRLIRLDKPVKLAPEGTSVTRVASGGVRPYRYTAAGSAVEVDAGTGRVVALANGDATVTVTDAQGSSASYPVTVSNVSRLVDLGTEATWSRASDLAHERGARLPQLVEWEAMRAAYDGSPEVRAGAAWTDTAEGSGRRFVFFPNTGDREGRWADVQGWPALRNWPWIPIGKPVPKPPAPAAPTAWTWLIVATGI